ncbi:TetR/AcrR family transcriptional regulator [Prevotella corporis]|jgi:AcrR family transcriptional regulator|uniref:TetR/AcrR family transcriptional regulator n=1 Tax=Prevotella corporis TaxID=28128 RepID=UPI0023F3627A|nr:helix-turn-helix domain-containing protein [Prevotella corporis]
MNKNNRKEQLYHETFKLFLSKPFEAVSIADIEEASGMTRGAITYYAKDKLGLFYSVVKHHLVDTQNLKQKITKTEFVSLKEFLEEYVNCCQETMNRFSDVDKKVQNASRAYASLILQICKYFPDLHAQYLENRNQEIIMWIGILQKAIENKEIRSDIDIMNTARNFMNIFYGQSYLDSLSAGLNVVELKMQLMNLYKLLKI